jgi:hypothetical protein
MLENFIVQLVSEPQEDGKIKVGTYLFRGQCYKTFFKSVIYGFSYLARVFVRLGWKTCQGQTNLLQKLVNYGQKMFYNIGPRPTHKLSQLGLFKNTDKTNVY